MLSHKTVINNNLNGGQVINNTTPVTGNWTEIRVITATVFTTLTGSPGITNVGSTSFPVGTVLNGRFTAITLASGSIVAYHAP
jgi:hypothetical protein